MNKTQLTKWLFAAVVLVHVCAVGCHRGYYRRQADNEAQQLVAEKNTDPRWNYADGSVDIDPQSRMFDPFSADHPPIPPDDAASHQLMHQVDGKDAYPHWHANGDTDFVENPEWRSYLPTNDKGQVVLDIETAFRLAQIHSPDFQQQRETLYLSALEVSLERFGFDSQLFAGWNSFFSTQGRLRGAGSASSLSTSLGSNGGGINLERLGVTGANFAVGLANSIMWNFSGTNTQSASSLIDFSIIQPLLRNAGRDRIMESLTQAERTLLANIRQMDRFRRGFYLEIIMGRNAGAGPSSSGNFLGSPGNANTNAGGYLGLLQQQQVIRIQEFNIRQLENVLDLFREFYDRERINALQVFQFENTVYESQNSLLSAKIQYQNSVDSFKRLLGLPPGLEVIIEDPFLDHFVFISDRINKRQIDLYGLKTLTGETVIGVSTLIENGGDPSAITERLSGIRDNIQMAIAMIDDVTENDTTEIANDLNRLREAIPRRLAYFKELRRTISQNKLLSDIDPSLFADDSIASPDELGANLANAVKNLTDVRQVLETVVLRIDDAPNQQNTLDAAEYQQYLTSILEQIPESLSVFGGILIEFSLVQAQARSDSIELDDVSISDEQAFSIARCFRRDWMNARASLVNQWRSIEVVADQLESQLDLVFDGSVGNFGDNPFKVRLETGQLRAGLRFDAPIVRMAERNNYRETLISYQQSKRSFYQFRDDVHLNLRQTIRNLNLNKALFEVNRKAVLAAIKQVDNSQLVLVQPVGPGQQARLGSTTSRDLTQSINTLQRSQTDFLRIWVNYEVARRNLDFDMGTMQLDETGQWLDPGEIDSSIAGRAASMLGIPLDCQFCDESTIFGSPGDEFSDPLQFEQPTFETEPGSDNGMNTPTLAPEIKNPAPTLTPQEIPAPTPPSNPTESRLESPTETPVPNQTNPIQTNPNQPNPNQPNPSVDDQKSGASFQQRRNSITAPFVLGPADEPNENATSMDLAGIEVVNKAMDLGSAEGKTSAPDQLKVADSVIPVKQAVAGTPTHFATTLAGRFVAISPKAELKTQPELQTGSQLAATETQIAPPPFRFSALPGYQPLEFANTQIGNAQPSMNEPVVFESVTSDSSDVEMLRPISATIDQLPWDSVQTSNTDDQPIARVINANTANPIPQMLLKPIEGQQQDRQRPSTIQLPAQNTNQNQQPANPLRNRSN